MTALDSPALAATDRATGTAVERRLRIGVDIGGSKIAVLVVDADGDVCARHRVAAAWVDPDAAVDDIGAAIVAALSLAGATMSDVDAVGVGVPGRVDIATGRVRFAVNLGWHDLALGERLEALLGVPCSVDNDVRAAAAGLHRRAPFGPIDNLAYLSVGTGISAGVVLDGRLHRGVRGIAGEIGHVVLEPDGPRCACGLRGCFEALAAGPAIAHSAREAAIGHPDSALAGVHEPTAVDVFGAAAHGDATALAVVDRAAHWVARGVHELALAYDVELIVIGGGVSRAGDTFLQPIVAALDAMCDESPFAREVLAATVVRLLPHDFEAGTWGAIALTENAVPGAVPGGAEE